MDHLFPAEAQIIIYRIFQECLTNISKHAGATEVSITIKEDDNLIALVLEDNGAGFDPVQVSGRRGSGRGMGLAALDERARMLGGTLKIRSQPGSGTRLTCIIPVEQRSKNRRQLIQDRRSRGADPVRPKTVTVRLLAPLTGTIRGKKVAGPSDLFPLPGRRLMIGGERWRALSRFCWLMTT